MPGSGKASRIPLTFDVIDDGACEEIIREA